MRWWKRWGERGGGVKALAAAGMTCAGLHAGEAFAAAMRSLVADVGILLARVFVAFQCTLSTMVTFARAQ